MEEPHVHDNLPAFPLKKCDDMYEVGLLWQGPDRPEDNKRQAVSSAVSLRRGLLKKNNLESYENVLMKEYQELDAIEKEPEPEHSGYYMPHHAVVREAAATTKLRVVFNASASQKGDLSLNEVIEPGPSLLPNLPGLLMLLREYRCAVQADIRKAFFMISVKEEDRRFLRFVWFTTEGKIEIWRLKKLPFGVNCSQFILNASHTSPSSSGRGCLNVRVCPSDHSHAIGVILRGRLPNQLAIHKGSWCLQGNQYRPHG